MKKVTYKFDGAIDVKGEQGFTLVELMISLVVTAILVGSIFATYQVQSSTYGVQREVSKMQQGLRGSLHVLTWDLHNALRDPSSSQVSRFTANNRRYNLAGGIDNAGQPGIEFDSLRFDNDGDGIFETNQNIRYWIQDADGDGIPGLYRLAAPDPADIGPPDPSGRLVADSIQAIGFAFAIDQDGDGALDRFNGDPLRSILWVVDSDNDGDLDANLDTNDDNRINELDNGTVPGFILPSGQPATPATYDQVRA
ncbi:MAG: prepilin-type N-terminal cleavage/methylation domain-containing protein, partial [Desulfatitalea sp.]